MAWKWQTRKSEFGSENYGVGAGLIVKELVEEVQEGGAEGVKAVGFAFEVVGCLLDSLFG